MNSSVLFDELQTVLKTEGPEAALARLEASLREQKDYNGLFYALLMKKRHQLGIVPVPTSPTQDIPELYHGTYEEAIRQAAREVGGLYLQEGNIPQAWPYFRMLNEPDPVRTALGDHQPGEDEDLQPLVQVAYYEGAHPRRGFDWVIERFGLCSAITTLGSHDLPHPMEDKQYCLGRLAQTLYAELRERLTAEISQREGPPLEANSPPGTLGVVRKLIQRDWLFEEDVYHIDLSHLSSVVQMSIHLPPGPDLERVRELCAYGQKLTGRFVQPGDPPFEEYYTAYDHYLGVISGQDVEEGLAYFRKQVETNSVEEAGTYPAEVLVNLLLKADRPKEALAVAGKYLVTADNRRLSCPSITELCQKTNDYQTLVNAARQQGDPIHFLAGLLASQK
jgi:hypothetical protein